MSNPAPIPANGTNGASAIVDSNGAAISVGSLVKVDCVVTAISPWSKHFLEVQVTPVNLANNPGLRASPVNNIPMYGGITNGSIDQALFAGKSFSITPSALTLGS